jgi:DNA-binding NarL/FixJ family response regulator
MKPTRQISVLLADDHAPVRHGLRALLDRDETIQVIGEARNGREAVELAHRLRPNVVLMDISMPLVNGLEATRKILARWSPAKVIILSAHVDDEYVKRAREVGAVGFVSKQASSEALTSAIHEAAMGRGTPNPAMPASPAREDDKAHARKGAARGEPGHLSSRESELLQLVAEGSRKRQIATELRISITAVERLLKGLMGKLGVAHVANLAAFAVASGYVESDVVLTIT